MTPQGWGQGWGGVILQLLELMAEVPISKGQALGVQPEKWGEVIPTRLTYAGGR